MFKVCIAGSRGFNNYSLLESYMDRVLKARHPHICIVEGGARGADLLGKRYAESRGYAVESYPANWDKHGKSAGYRRNVEMAEASNACVVFWDGVSKGSKHMIDICQARSIPLRVVRTNE